MQPTSGDGESVPAATHQEAPSAATAQPDLTDLTSAHPARPQAWMSDLQPAHQAPRFDPTVAHPARVYAYWLGGKDHFPPDRKAAEEVARLRLQVVAGEPGVPGPGGTVPGR
jgi:S-adenosyl methyltransferase